MTAFELSDWQPPVPKSSEQPKDVVDIITLFEEENYLQAYQALNDRDALDSQLRKDWQRMAANENLIHGEVYDHQTNIATSDPTTSPGWINEDEYQEILDRLAGAIIKLGQ